ncbi:MAG: thioredoxin family protein [Bdellovibrionales bacterium]
MTNHKAHGSSKLTLSLLGGLLIWSCLTPSETFALASEWQREEGVAVRLISGVEGVGQGDSVPLGLDVQLDPGWHTYWRSPGMAGLPPQIQWKLDATSVASPEVANLGETTLHYPIPERFTDSGIETIGYRERVVFPIDAKINHPGQALEVRPSVDILICNNICLPRHLVLSLKIPAGAATEGPESELLKEFRAKVPQNPTAAGIDVKDAAVMDDGLTLRVEATEPFDKPELLIENDAELSFAAPSATLSPDRRAATFSARLTEPLQPDKTLERQSLTVTVIDGARGMEQKIRLPARGENFEGATKSVENIAPTSPTSQRSPQAQPQGQETKTRLSLSFGLAIFVALIGGFILNLMPCVLPVLSLKVLSVIGHGGNKRQTVRRSFLTTASGIVASFLALAGLTIALQQLGHNIGWGVQFQQPTFLVFLTLLVTIFAASLWDLITLRLPYWMTGGWGSWKERRKDSQPGQHLAGDFMTGAFATLLATPCSAPFLGTAVGFALTTGPVETLAIFAALGFGMSLPYLTVAAFPRIATALPRPGVWMIHLRHALGVALALTAVWLVWVLSVQIEMPRAIFIGLCMIGIVLVLALRRTGASRRKYAFAGLAVFAVVALAIAGAAPLAPAMDKAQAYAQWKPLDEAELRRAVAEGKTVFVDVTADWCLTCKANKRFVLSRDDVKRRLFETGIVAMRADWTKPDPTIAEFLHAYGRYGIPFNIVFGPKAQQGIILPELLSRDAVMNALDQAEGN